MAPERKDIIDEHSSSATPDFQLATQTLAPGGVSARALLNVASAVLLVLIIVGSGWYFRQAQHVKNIVGAARFASPIATPIVPPLPPAGTGWENAGPAGAFGFAQSVSDPLTAYTCDIFHAGIQPALVPVVLGVSHDAGVHWNTLATPAQGESCQLSVNPTDGRDVFLFAQGCSDCSDTPYTRLYRTRDGGASWTAWTLPSRADIMLDPFGRYIDHWVGDTFFLFARSLNAQAWRYIAVSRQGGAFTWADTGYLANAPSNANISASYTFGSSLFLRLGSASVCDPCQHLWRTDDEGRSWHVVDLPNGGNTPFLIGETTDGTTLLGHSGEGEGPGKQRLWQSQDGGQTWQALPPFPAGTTFDSPIDGRGGVFYEELQFSDGDAGIYALTVDSQQWRLVGAGPRRIMTAAWIMWSQGGTALSLWGMTGGIVQSPRFFLQRFSLGG